MPSVKNRTILEELVTIIGFEVDRRSLDTLDDRIRSAERTLQRFTRAITVSGAAIAAWLTVQTNAEVSAKRLGEAIGLNVQQFKELRFAASQFGVGAGGIESLLSRIASLSTAAQRGQGGAAGIFGKLGIRAVEGGRARDTMTLMLELFDRMKTLPRERQFFAMESFGFDTDMLNFMRQSRGEVERLRNEFRRLQGPTADRRGDEAERLWKSFMRARIAAREFANEIAFRAEPSLTSFLDSAANFLGDNDKLAATIGTIFEKSIKPVLLAIAFVLRKRIFALLRLIPQFRAAIIAGLALEDLINAIMGKPSVLGAIRSGLENWSRNVIRPWFDNLLKGFQFPFGDEKVSFGGFGTRGVTPQAILAGASSSSNGSVIQNIQIDVSATDPQLAAVTIKRGLEEFAREAVLNVKSSVVA